MLFDKAINDIEHSRFESARLLLQTLMNTYDTSEYLAKAKLAIADAWFREGGGHGMAQAEAEYKDFILFYPDDGRGRGGAGEDLRDAVQADGEGRPRPDARAARRGRMPAAAGAVPEQQVRAAGAAEAARHPGSAGRKEFRVGTFYQKKGSLPAAANRLQGVADQFPLYSKADEALWQLAERYTRMGDRFENQQATAYTRIVKDYPLSVHVEEAKARLQAMNRPVPEADPVAYARMKYEIENRTEPRASWARCGDRSAARPDMTGGREIGHSADDRLPSDHSGQRARLGGGAAATGVNEVGVAVAADGNALDKNPDARANPPAPAGTASYRPRPPPPRTATAPPADATTPASTTTRRPDGPEPPSCRESAS